MYDVYATKEELAEYLSVTVESLSSDSDRLLIRASELINQLTHNNYDPLNTDHVEAVSLATCAQVEEWMSVGETKAISPDVKQYSLGSLSITSGDNKSQLSNRSKSYLNKCYLLYAGRRTRCVTLDGDAN